MSGSTFFEQLLTALNISFRIDVGWQVRDDGIDISQFSFNDFSVECDPQLTLAPGGEKIGEIALERDRTRVEIHLGTREPKNNSTDGAYQSELGEGDDSIIPIDHGDLTVGDCCDNVACCESVTNVFLTIEIAQLQLDGGLDAYFKALVVLDRLGNRNSSQPPDLHGISRNESAFWLQRQRELCGG